MTKMKEESRQSTPKAKSVSEMKRRPTNPRLGKRSLSKKYARFDTKLSAEQKTFFEKAVDIGQYRSLSDFILKAAQEKAEEVIARHKNFLTSLRDQEVFFKAMINPPQPNIKLQTAMKNYLDSTDRE